VLNDVGDSRACSAKIITACPAKGRTEEKNRGQAYRHGQETVTSTFARYLIRTNSKRAKEKQLSLQDVGLTSHQLYCHASSLFLRSQKKKKGGMGVGESEDKRLYTSRFFSGDHNDEDRM
jgi:hypothetical protein